MSNHGWDGGCWIVLDRDCEPISDYHHVCEADAHAAALPLGFYVRREPCTEHAPAFEPLTTPDDRKDQP